MYGKPPAPLANIHIWQCSRGSNKQKIDHFSTCNVFQNRKDASHLQRIHTITVKYNLLMLNALLQLKNKPHRNINTPKGNNAKNVIAYSLLKYLLNNINQHSPVNTVSCRSPAEFWSKEKYYFLS